MTNLTNTGKLNNLYLLYSYIKYRCIFVIFSLDCFYFEFDFFLIYIFSLEFV